MSIYNKYQRREMRAKQLDAALKGEGLYIYENHTKGDMLLPKPTDSGQTKVAAGAQFQGDNYFMQLVRNNQCRLIQQLISPEQERAMNEARLVLDQPQIVKESGPVEYVQGKQTNLTKPVNETAAKNNEVPQLLVEEPVDGVDILTD